MVSQYGYDPLTQRRAGGRGRRVGVRAAEQQAQQRDQVHGRSSTCGRVGRVEQRGSGSVGAARVRGLLVRFAGRSA